MVEEVKKKIVYFVVTTILLGGLLYSSVTSHKLETELTYIKGEIKDYKEQMQNDKKEQNVQLKNIKFIVANIARKTKTLDEKTLDKILSASDNGLDPQFSHPANSDVAQFIEQTEGNGKGNDSDEYSFEAYRTHPSNLDGIDGGNLDKYAEHAKGRESPELETYDWRVTTKRGGQVYAMMPSKNNRKSLSKYLKKEAFDKKSELVTANSHNTHLVQKGDTLSKIAMQYQTTVEKLKKFNNLKSDKILKGQVLVIRVLADGPKH